MTQAIPNPIPPPVQAQLQEMINKSIRMLADAQYPVGQRTILNALLEAAYHLRDAEVSELLDQRAKQTGQLIKAALEQTEIMEGLNTRDAEVQALKEKLPQIEREYYGKGYARGQTEACRSCHQCGGALDKESPTGGLRCSECDESDAETEADVERLTQELKEEQGLHSLSGDAHREIREICKEVDVRAAFSDDAVRVVVDRLKDAEAALTALRGAQEPQDGEILVKTWLASQLKRCSTWWDQYGGCFWLFIMVVAIWTVIIGVVITLWR